MRDPVVLQLLADLPLRVLDLENATLPWSSYPTVSQGYVNYTWTSLNVMRLWRFQRDCLRFLRLPLD